MICGEPVAEIEDDSREEAGLREAEKEPEDIEANRASGEGHRDRDQTPGNHDPADPETRSDMVQDDAGGHFEGEVAEEEDARAEAEHPRRHSYILFHDHGADPYSHPIEQAYKQEA